MHINAPFCHFLPPVLTFPPAALAAVVFFFNRAQRKLNLHASHCACGAQHTNLCGCAADRIRVAGAAVSARSMQVLLSDSACTPSGQATTLQLQRAAQVCNAYGIRVHRLLLQSLRTRRVTASSHCSYKRCFQYCSFCYFCLPCSASTSAAASCMRLGSLTTVGTTRAWYPHA